MIFFIILTLNHSSMLFYIIFFSINWLFNIDIRFYFLNFIFDGFITDLLKRVVMSFWYNNERFRQQNTFDWIETSNHDSKYATKINYPKKKNYPKKVCYKTRIIGIQVIIRLSNI